MLVTTPRQIGLHRLPCLRQHPHLAIQTGLLPHAGGPLRLLRWNRIRGHGQLQLDRSPHSAPLVAAGPPRGGVSTGGHGGLGVATAGPAAEEADTGVDRAVPA